jgi:hypothetical protein
VNSGFYAKNDNGSMIVSQGAKVLYEVRSDKIHAWIDKSASTNMDAYGWSNTSWGAQSYVAYMAKYLVDVYVPVGSVMPVLFFTAAHPQHLWVTSVPFQSRSSSECDAVCHTWTEGRNNTPSFVAGISDVAMVSSNQNGFDCFRFTVLVSVNDTGVWNTGGYVLNFRAFTSVPTHARDMSQTVGAEVFYSDGSLAFTTRPNSYYFITDSVMQVQGMVDVELPQAVADGFSMAPSGNSLPGTSSAKWLSYYCGSFAAKVGETKVYRSHEGGTGYAEVKFTDNYYFTSHGFYTSGVTPGAVNGSVYCAGVTISAGRTLGKAHSEDWGSLGVVGTIAAAVATVVTGGGFLAVVAAATVAGSVISSLTFYNGIGVNQTRIDKFTGDHVMWL